MPMPKIDEANRKKPLCYDPTREKFILYDEIVSGEERIVDIDTLSEDDLKKLIAERHRKGPDYTVRAISGPPMSRNDVTAAIEKSEQFGIMTVQAEKSYLRDLLKEIRKNLKP
jgi:hypothetical protein